MSNYSDNFKRRIEGSFRDLFSETYNSGKLELIENYYYFFKENDIDFVIDDVLLSKISNYKPEILEFFIKNEYANKDNYQFKRNLCYNNKIEHIKIIFKYGADLKFNNEEMLFNACWNRNEELALYLYKNGCDISVVEKEIVKEFKNKIYSSEEIEETMKLVNKIYLNHKLKEDLNNKPVNNIKRLKI